MAFGLQARRTAGSSLRARHLLLLRVQIRSAPFAARAQPQGLNLGCRVRSGAAHDIFQLLLLQQIQNLFRLAKPVRSRPAARPACDKWTPSIARIQPAVPYPARRCFCESADRCSPHRGRRRWPPRGDVVLRKPTIIAVSIAPCISGSPAAFARDNAAKRIGERCSRLTEFRIGPADGGQRHGLAAAFPSLRARWGAPGSSISSALSACPRSR